MRAAAALFEAGTPASATALHAALTRQNAVVPAATRQAYVHHAQRRGKEWTRVESIIDAIVGTAIEQSEASGDGMFLEGETNNVAALGYGVTPKESDDDDEEENMDTESDED
ncbi:hypothetical protein WJX72_001379 [[Myrmecia] bisecta]|uniref:Uncharacterized protein n=1 Tax=[Myrmecia] bisecta TaxID=41462 RepID=A0AAW1QNY8_9CHLO